MTDSDTDSVIQACDQAIRDIESFGQKVKQHEETLRQFKERNKGYDERLKQIKFKLRYFELLKKTEILEKEREEMNNEESLN